MKRVHVIFQNKNDADRETRLRLRMMWWVIASFLFALLFYFITKSTKVLGWGFFGFLALFMICNATKDYRIKAYINILIGSLYLVWSILFIGFIFYFKEQDTNNIIMILVISGVFFYLGYKKLNSYTNLMNILFQAHAGHSASHSNSGFSKKNRITGFNKGNRIIKFFIFLFTFSIGYFIALNLISHISVSNKIIFFLLLGLIVESTSKIMQIFIYDKKWVFDKRFVFWVITISTGLFLSQWVISKMPSSILLFIVSNASLAPYLSLLLMGLVLTIFVYIIWWTKIEGRIFSN